MMYRLRRTLSLLWIAGSPQGGDDDSDYNILLEDGDDILLEDDSYILLEDAA